VLIIQFDDRPLAELGRLNELIKKNNDYAKHHGYDHKFLNSIGNGVASYWAKVFVTEYYLRSEYDIVMWLDTDAVIHNFDFRLTDLFLENEVFVFASDSPPWHGPFNAGVFLCKGERGRQLMEEWKSYYQPDLWFQENGKWICKSDQWSDAAYEQGAFYRNLLPKYGSSGLLRSYSWKILQSPYPQPESFTVHFAGEHKINVLIYLRT
jgi:hypothetical protein